MNNKKSGFAERFFAWLFEPVNDIVEDATDSKKMGKVPSERSERVDCPFFLKEEQLLKEEDEGSG
ncbi:MAG: hypothetical protein KAQ99_06890 [Candidatus Aureabacteria bacterium]|nr:hypothetical protein [Candidatus Auribacterota bacterium]MCK5161286.1 hypothetical protein [Candidatus Auribacterota bacterium]